LIERTVFTFDLFMLLVFDFPWTNIANPDTDEIRDTFGSFCILGSIRRIDSSERQRDQKEREREAGTKMSKEENSR